MFTPKVCQTECLESIAKARAQGRKKVLIIMASGLGKTVTMAFDARSFLEEFGKGRILYLCHQNDILYQAKTTFEIILGPTLTYGFFNGEEKNIHNVDCLFGSFPTMVNNTGLFNPDEFDYILVDEGHHSHAETFKSVVDFFTPKFMLAATATPDRGDQQDIRSIYGEEVYNLSLVEALNRELLSPVEYKLLSDELQLDGILDTPVGKLSVNLLNKTVFVPKRDEEIVRIVNRHVAEIENPRIIYFCSSVQHCNHLAGFVPDCMAIHSRIPYKERSVRLELFRQGLIGTAITVDCFNEGVDVPEANVLVFLRSTASKRIFFQQLGRGLRLKEGKTRVIVLDFVNNCERLTTVYELHKAIREEWDKVGGGQHRAGRQSIPPMTLNIEGSKFDEKIVKIIAILERLSLPFYPTWQEAAAVAQELGVKSSGGYKFHYRKDPRLPSMPQEYYSDFPGWYNFLGKAEKVFYQTWEEAGKAAEKLMIKTSGEYQKKYKSDPRLPFNPKASYVNFPGWIIFLGGSLKDFYPTWQEAGAAAAKLGFTTIGVYKERYTEDKRLTSSPKKIYPDFPNWPTFLGNKRARIKETPYPTWQEAREAALKLGIKDSDGYKKEYVKDPKLPSAPRAVYPNFPGFRLFLLKSTSYSTWQEAGVAALKLGIKTPKEYERRYKEDLKLPSTPRKTYADFPGFRKFLSAGKGD